MKMFHLLFSLTNQGILYSYSVTVLPCGNGQVQVSRKANGDRNQLGVWRYNDPKAD